MAVRQYKPTSAGRRFQSVPSFSEITKTKEGPERSLLAPLHKRGGRNNRGRLTVLHRGGGHIAQLHYRDGEKRYILAPAGLDVGHVVMSGESADIRPGNCLPLRCIPVGTIIHNLELKIGKGAQIVRSAGTAAQLMAREGVYATVKLPSGEMRLVHQNCKATIGQVGHLDHENVSYGKAGRSRWFGRRPRVRGIAMNPVDHPLGGGEGRSKGNHPMSPWGVLAKGYKTRRRSKSDKYIVQKRKK